MTCRVYSGLAQPSPPREKASRQPPRRSRTRRGPLGQRPRLRGGRTGARPVTTRSPTGPYLRLRNDPPANSAACVTTTKHDRRADRRSRFLTGRAPQC
jgi:hypothetical protein